MGLLLIVFGLAAVIVTFYALRMAIGGGSPKCAACGKALGRVGMKYAPVCHHCGHHQGTPVL